jgi:serine/threonine protein phosphatase PrpC
MIGALHSDIGNYRNTNEDSVYMDIKDTSFGQVAIGIVCDGMGGHSAGDYASRRVADVFVDWYNFNFLENMEKGYDLKQIHDEWHDLLNVLNSELVHYGLNNGMEVGTTATVVLFLGKKYFCIHVGDSRFYEITQEVRQLTRDHTLVARDLESGAISPQEAKHSASRHILLTCIGIKEEFDYHFISGDIRDDSSYLICTDGLYDKLEDEELADAFYKTRTEYDKEIEAKIIDLVETVKERGEKDNISAVVLKAVDTSSSSTEIL